MCQAAQQCHATYMKLQRARRTEEQKQKNRIQNKENEKTQGEKKKGQKGIQNTTRS